jgi:hypothetical protein
MEGMRNACGLLMEKLKVYHLEDLTAEGILILKWILKLDGTSIELNFSGKKTNQRQAFVNTIINLQVS